MTDRTIKKLIQCARCGGAHTDLVFKEFTRPTTQYVYTHFCLCPTNGEPILLFERED